MLKFFIIFLLVQGSLFGLQLWRPIHENVVLPFTTGLARISAKIVGAFDGGVVSSGIILHHVPNNFAVSIESGCNGVEAMIILAAAIVAFPAHWKHKAIGLILGFTAIQALNLVRIISLFYLGQWNMAVFEWTHMYLWQALIMLDALVFWLVWIRMLPSRRATGFFQTAATSSASFQTAARSKIPQTRNQSQSKSKRKHRRKK